MTYLGEGNGNPLQCSCLENPRDGGAWWAAIYGVAQSRTRLKRLSSSSMPFLFIGFWPILLFPTWNGNMKTIKVINIITYGKKLGGEENNY